MTEITISPEWEMEGDRIIRVREGCLESISMPSTITKINGNEVEWKKMRSYTIPPNVTKLGDYYFFFK